MEQFPVDWRAALALAGRSAFVGLVLAAAIGDVRTRRIPNRLNLALALLGLAVAVLVGGASGLVTSCVALGVGLLLWVPLFAIGFVGAGDAKLMAAAAAWLTPIAVLRASAIGAVAGGLLAALWMIRVRGLALNAERLAHAPRNSRVLREPMHVAGRDARLPYGVALAVGLLAEAARLWWVPR